MTWNINITAPSRSQAKNAVAAALAKSMSVMSEHALDFEFVLRTLFAAIDLVEEGTVSVNATGYLSVGYEITPPVVTGVYITSMYVTSAPKA